MGALLGRGQAVYSRVIALLQSDSITFPRPEVVGLFVVFLVVLAAIIGIMLFVFRRR